ncbi:MAG TPA: hypothetical protein VLG47_03240 [Candidatus Saccharimonadales bacterium]|nr:hypothetical protein [Candidatus Saccharimonadales bacterium]
MGAAAERVGNFVRRRDARAYGVVAASILLAAACTSSSSKPSASSYPGLPPNTCSSYASYSQIYPGDPTAKGKKPAEWTHGLVAHTRDLPRGTGYRGIQMGWYTPSPGAEADVHWSRIIQGPNGKNVFAFVGGGPVGFEVRLVLTVNNTAVPKECTQIPDTQWFPKSPQLGDVAIMQQEQWFTPSAQAKFPA